jgi:pyridinium-3,5-bisthiocarboxylic acid mononucleotide nickel chelatase
VRIAYLDCSSGISGDMTVAALIDVGVDFQAIRAGVESLGLTGVRLSTETVMRCGFRGTYLKIEHPEQHAHRHYQEICRIIDGASALTPRQKELARRIFAAIGEAEARVHGTSLDAIHFHEVGAIDSIVDIVASAIGFDLLRADEIVASPVPTGRGKVKIAHGVCTVPTPGTAELLKGMPLVDVPVEAELTTPTGAAILKTMVNRFGPLPAMTLETAGYGAGTKDFPDRANLLRLLVGTTTSAAASDQVWLLETNLDDVSAEVIGYAKRKLLAAGALDVFSTPIQMKKDRPGTLVSVICHLPDREKLEAILFSETATFGIRRHLVERSKRMRQACTVETAWGPVQGKLGEIDRQVVFTPEFEACAALAARFNVPLRQVYQGAEEAFRRDPIAFDAPPAADPGEVRPHDHVHDHSHDHNHSHDHSHDHDHHH